VKNTKRKPVLGTVLALSLAVIIALAVVFPAVAIGKKNPDVTVTASNQGHVSLELPPPGGAPPPAGVAGHPTDIVLSFYDYYKGPASGADVIVVYIWVSALNKYIPIAAIGDQAPSAQIKAFWNNTPVYLEVDGVVIRNNLKTVADKELDVWVEMGRCPYGHAILAETGRCFYGHRSMNAPSSTTFIANLTVPVGPLDYTGLPAIFGSTFTVPAMDVTFRQITESYLDVETGVLPDGSTEKTTATKVPAWVNPHIPAWFNGPCMDVGFIMQETIITTPP